MGSKFFRGRSLFMWLVVALGILIALVIIIILSSQRSKRPAPKPPSTIPQKTAATLPQKRFINPMQRSWAFLHRLTKTIRAKFSTKDQETVRKLGEKMLQQGVQYRHVVDMRKPKQVAAVGKTPATTPSKNQPSRQ